MKSQATVLDIDPNQQRISLGMKQLKEDPWNNINSLFKIGDIISGKVTKVTAYGAFISLKDDIDGLVHISQISEDHVEKVKDLLKIDQEVTARVIKIDHDERRVGLSIKAASYDADKLASEVSAYENLKNDQELTSLGDILDQASNDYNHVTQ